ncbi:MAG: hypothetical protein ACI9W2_000084 [Gammaproteobacteria bacterium]|jgi:hypothetical protein
MMTPYDKLKSLPNAHTYLRQGLTFGTLDAQAHGISDNDAGEQLQLASVIIQTPLRTAQPSGLTMFVNTTPLSFRRIRGLE